MIDDEDDSVDGAKIAARILERLPSAHREKLMQTITRRDPSAAQKITKKTSTFSDIANLTEQGVQILVKAVEHQDLVISLKTADEKTTKVLYANMSERKRKVVQEDFAALPKMKLSEVEEAQRRILNKLDELQTLGLVRSQDEKDLWV